MRCRACGSNATYSSKTHRYTCECGNSWLVLPIKDKCRYCGADYEKYTWHDPSGCRVCHKSFVD